MDASEEFVFDLGKLISNFQSLEFVLRFFLYHQADPPHTSFQPGQPIYSAKVGDVCPVNAFTSYDTLGQLIDRFNRRVEKQRHDLVIDRSMVDVRDALAHGRVSSFKPEPPLWLVKYAKPSGGSAVVTTSIEVTSDWLAKERRRVHDAIVLVKKAEGHFPHAV